MKMKSSTKAFIGVIAIILSIVLWYTVTMIQAKARMEWFLRDEYGKEFVVEGVHYRYPYLGGSLQITGMAHAKDDPGLKFDITRTASDNDPETKFYGETYIKDLWEKQKREEIKTVLNSDVIWTMILATYKEEELYGKTISIDKAEQLFKDQIDLYISYGLFIGFREYNNRFNEFKNCIKGNLTPEQAENLFHIIKRIQNKNYKEIDLEITYFNDKCKKDVKKDPEGYLTGKVSYFEELSTYKKGTVLCQFRIDDINRIYKPEDVGKFINPKAGYIYQD